MIINVIGPRDTASTDIVVDVTSRSNEEWSKSLSPFRLGPVKLSDGRIARNLENAWQFSKVYDCHTDSEGYPNDEWYDWSSRGFADNYAHRYPMGKGAKPLYSWCHVMGRLNYIEARKFLYSRWYEDTVIITSAYKRLNSMVEKNIPFTIFDFDGYDFKKKGMTYEDVLNYQDKPLGHGIVLAGLLEGVDFQDLEIYND